jgi:hypothetical protein
MKKHRHHFGCRMPRHQLGCRFTNHLDFAISYQPIYALLQSKNLIYTIALKNYAWEDYKMRDEEFQRWVNRRNTFLAKRNKFLIKIKKFLIKRKSFLYRWKHSLINCDDLLVKLKNV